MKISSIRAGAALAIAGIAIAVGCATTPTGRKTIHLLPADQMTQLGVQSFQQLQQQTPVDHDPQADAYVRCVANAVTESIPQDLEPPKSWEVVVFQDPTANAFALPGGKIGVHSGMLKLATDQGQLATVLGHEVSHVLAQHGNERISESLVAESGLALLSALAQTSDPEKAKKRQLILGLLGVGAQVGVLLPFSRTQETEADRMGLDLMARAGFDPSQAIVLWKAMEKSGGQQPPEFLSDHPSHGSRIQDLEARLPQAMALYQEARSAGRNPACGQPPAVASLSGAK